MAHHVVDEKRRAITVPSNVGGDVLADAVTDGGLVVPVAIADVRAVFGQPRMRLYPKI